MRSILLTLAASAALAMSGAALAQKAEDLMKTNGCINCHDVSTKKVGPAFKDIAAKYKGKDVTAQLVDKVRKGGSGSFGPIPMSPNGPDKIDDADLKAAVEFILKS